MAKQRHIKYALKNGMITSISDVERGLKCGCVCSACGAKLVARKGTKKIHHFAHYAGEDCEYGYESSLHLAAKEILSKSKKMIVPPTFVHFSRSYKKDELIFEEMEIEIDRVELEKRFCDIVPDIVVYSNEKTFFVEIFVTHNIDNRKLSKIKKADISTIEIDLSDLDNHFSTEDLSDILLGSSDRKTWKYNSTSTYWLKQFIESADKKTITKRGFSLHVDGCPISARSWRGKPYANFMNDCLYCEYCICNARDDYMLCSGRLRVATVKDFETSEKTRIQKSDAKQQKRREKSLANGKCPNCGGDLIERSGRYGIFLGCTQYPHCRFTALIDSETGEISL